MLWGEAADTGELQPLAIATDLAPAPHVVTGEALGGLRLSTDAAKGLTSYPLRKMRFGFRNDVIHRLLVVEYTPDGRGTSVAPELTIETTDPEMDLSDWTLGPVGASGKACFHMSFFFTVLHNGPFTRDRIKAVTLRNTSRDAWRPANLFLFGFTSAPTVLIPIVYMPEWNFGFLSTDRTEGDESVSLPLAAPLDRLPPRPVPDFPVEDIHIQVSGKRGPFTLTYSEIG
jgi:hypothetical protein